MMERLRESRWVYILISVLLAVVFWLYIRDTEDPTMSRPIYNVPVQIANERVLEERGLTVSGLSQSSLTVEVTGPVSVLNNLTRSNITASVDVSSITETGEHELNCRLILPNNVDTTGAFFPEQSNPVTVTVDTLVTETMNVEVRLEGSVADGYQAGTPVADPETVELRGSAEQVGRVKRVAAILEAEGKAEAILKVQQALADSIEMLNKANPNDQVVKIKALEAFQAAADGRATKIIIPSEIQGLAGLCASAKGVFDSMEPNPPAKK